MHRECPHCHKPLTPRELCKEESKSMEADRKQLGLKGVLFRYYSCMECGHPDIFVDVHPLPGEAEDAYRRRKEELLQTIKGLAPGEAEVVMVERPIHA